MKSAIITFSATGNTAKIGGIIREIFIELGVDVQEFDITSFADRNAEIDLAPFDTVVFGMPVHSCRAPRVVREWMSTLQGNGKKCAMFFTFGGFGVHPCHYTTREILTRSGFTVVSSAEFAGAHTYNVNNGWRAMIDRPDESDFEVAREFARNTWRRFTGEDTGVLGELEKTEMDEAFLDMIESFRFQVVSELPNRRGETCSLCMLCEDLCPTQAILAEEGVADKDKCICCMRCLTDCPDGVLKVNDLSVNWPMKLEMHETTEEELKLLTSRTYF